MAIPEYPITRREQYLDAIVTNDTSVLPAEPITREEQYLDAIARNGGGGGSGGGVLVVHGIYDEQTETDTLDKTWQEIYDADFAVLRSEGNAGLTVCPLIAAQGSDGNYLVLFIQTYPVTPVSFEVHMYKADSADGYPVYVDK